MVTFHVSFEIPFPFSSHVEGFPWNERGEGKMKGAKLNISLSSSVSERMKFCGRKLGQKAKIQERF